MKFILKNVTVVQTNIRCWGGGKVIIHWHFTPSCNEHLWKTIFRLLFISLLTYLFDQPCPSLRHRKPRGEILRLEFKLRVSSNCETAVCETNLHKAISVKKILKFYDNKDWKFHRKLLVFEISEVGHLFRRITFLSILDKNRCTTDMCFIRTSSFWGLRTWAQVIKVKYLCVWVCVCVCVYTSVFVWLSGYPHSQSVCIQFSVLDIFSSIILTSTVFNPLFSLQIVHYSPCIYSIVFHTLHQLFSLDL